MNDFEIKLSEVFVRTKLHKKGSRIYIYIFYLRKLSCLRGQCCSIALVIDTFYVKYCSVLQHDLFIEITFLSYKKKISRSFFYAVLCDQKLLKRYLSISIMSSVQFKFRALTLLNY